MFANRHRVLRSRPAAVCAAGVCAAVMWTATSSAQQTTVIATNPAAPETVTTVEGYNGPNRVLFSAGLATFGLAYTPAIIVAAESPLTADKTLYAPVAGPWVNLGNRPDCGQRVSCDLEMVNKVLIATDGVFQGLGALAFAASLVLPEHHTKTVVTASEAPSLQVAPAQLSADGYGAVVSGRF